VRRIDGPDGPELHRAVDLARDQSWFLFATTRAQLAASLFPLGGMADKQAVRAEAARLGLPVALKPDSQDICFVTSGSYADAVIRLRPHAGVPGEIVARDGRVLGRHDGIARYTVGQGRRLGSASFDGGQRQVVVALDAARRRVIVGPRQSGGRAVRLREMNWLAEPTDAPLACEVKLRAREAPHPATVVPHDGQAATVFLREAALAAPGQACVLYRGSRVLGGGVICRTEIDAAA
jgi:tRNA-specific 2-thiouridylase